MVAEREGYLRLVFKKEDGSKERLVSGPCLLVAFSDPDNEPQNNEPQILFRGVNRVTVEVCLVEPEGESYRVASPPLVLRMNGRLTNKAYPPCCFGLGVCLRRNTSRAIMNRLNGLREDGGGCMGWKTRGRIWFGELGSALTNYSQRVQGVQETL